MAKDVPDTLTIVSADLSPEHTTVVVVNPCLFRKTFDMLTNKDYIKLCGDGTFRMIHGGWVLLNLGVLSKHCAPVGQTMANLCFSLHLFPFALCDRQ